MCLKGTCQSLLSSVGINIGAGRGTYELPEGDLRSSLVEHEIPCITSNSRNANICADHHISEEQPTTDQSLISLARRAAHNIMIRRVETECCGWETVCDKVDPE